MVRYGIRLALGSQGTHVNSVTCSREDGPFTCVMCDKPLNLRAGAKTIHHFAHKSKSSCEGNTDEHRAQADALGSVPETEPEETSTGSIPETQDQVSESEPGEASTGSIPETQDQVLESEPIRCIEEPMPDLLPVDVLAEPMEEEGEAMDPEVPDIEDSGSDVAEDVSHDIIEDALNFVVNEILEPHKCTDCKKMGSGFNRMFTDEAREKFDLNDLFVCDSCIVRCPACDGPNSQKRSRRNPLCFTCDFEKGQWEEEANEALEKMEPIPESPEWLRDNRGELVLKLLLRKQKARVVYNFMVLSKDRIEEYVQVIGSQAKANAIKRALKKERKESGKTRKRNEEMRNRKMGTQATEKYKLMFANKKEICPCGKQNKRRSMVRYASVLGSIKYSCNKCSIKCPGCSEPCTQNDLDKYGSVCFQCLAWGADRSDLWGEGEASVIAGCTRGSVDHMAVLYTHGPMVSHGKYSGDRLVHVPTGELDNVVRRDHPKFKAISDAIKACRKM